MVKNLLFGAIIPLLLVAVGVGVMIGMKRPVPGKKPPVEDNRGALLGQMLAADVQTVRALAEFSETLEIPVNGLVVPYREISLAAEVAGRITEKDPKTRSGNFVQEGDVLYRIDPRDYELEVQRVTRRLEQERAALTEQQQDINNARRLLEVAEQEMQLAEAEVERFERLSGNFRSEAELDQAKRARLSSMNQRVTIQNQVSLFEARSARLQSAIQLAETELQQAELNLERTVVRSPVAGRVVSEQVEADSYVQRGTPLVTIEDTSSVEVAVNVRMDQLYWILDQQQLSADTLVNAAQASLYELPRNEVTVVYQLAGRESARYEWQGVLSRYDGAGIDPQSRTVPIRVLVPNPGEVRINGQAAADSKLSGPSSLVRGMFVEVLIQAKPSTPLLLVPKLSVKPATGTNQIWKFIPDSSALDQTRRDLQELGRLAVAGVQLEGIDESAVGPVLEDSEDWQEGFLRVVEGVSVIGPYRGENSGLVGGHSESRADVAADEESSSKGEGPMPSSAEVEIEYWVCEVANGGVVAGDRVVVTPLPGIEAEGDEPIRVRKTQLE